MLEYTPEDVAAEIEKLDSHTWSNKHGEKFTIHSNGVMVWMSGDEVSAMVDPKHLTASKYLQLFSNHFGIWSADELYELGNALMVLAKKNGAGR